MTRIKFLLLLPIPRSLIDHRKLRLSYPFKSKSTNINFLVTISVYNQKKRLWETVKWSGKETPLIFFQILWTNFLRKCMKIVCWYWGLKGLNYMEALGNKFYLWVLKIMGFWASDLYECLRRGAVNPIQLQCTFSIKFVKWKKLNIHEKYRLDYQPLLT